MCIVLLLKENERLTLLFLQMPLVNYSSLKRLYELDFILGFVLKISHFLSMLMFLLIVSEQHFDCI